ncbi:MAG: transposase [Anaerolineales bacterium]
MSFIHRFGASLNRHVHYHCCVIDGVLERADNPSGGREHVDFRLTPQAIAAICEQVRVRVLRWFARSGLIDRGAVREMLTWENSGFSLDAEVRIAARDGARLERLLRSCARPPFAL